MLQTIRGKETRNMNPPTIAMERQHYLRAIIGMLHSIHGKEARSGKKSTTAME